MTTTSGPLHGGSFPAGGAGASVPVEVLPAVRAGGSGARGGPGAAGPAGGARPDVEVGAFRRGDPLSRAALARLLVARTVGDGAVTAVALLAFGLLALTVVLAVVGAPVALTVLVGLVAVGWLLAWRLVRALWRRLAGGPGLAAVRPELDRLVHETRPDVRHELHRLGLPSHRLAALSFAVRLAGHRRAETARRMHGFDVDRVVPADRVDRLFLLLDRSDLPHGALR